MKLNRMVCPRCSHEMLTDCAYARCDSCGVTFYASQQNHVQLPMQTSVMFTYGFPILPVPQETDNG